MNKILVQILFQNYLAYSKKTCKIINLTEICYDFSVEFNIEEVGIR